MFFDPYEESNPDGMLAWRPETYTALANLPKCGHGRCGQTAMHPNHRRSIAVIDKGTFFFGLFACDVERMVDNPNYHPFTPQGLTEDGRKRAGLPSAELEGFESREEP